MPIKPDGVEIVSAEVIESALALWSEELFEQRIQQGVEPEDVKVHPEELGVETQRSGAFTLTLPV